jgi:hypothetical protein
LISGIEAGFAHSGGCGFGHVAVVARSPRRDGGPGIPRLRVACDLEEASGNSIGGGLCVAGGLPRLTWRSCFGSGDSVLASGITSLS